MQYTMNLNIRQYVKTSIRDSNLLYKVILLCLLTLHSRYASAWDYNLVDHENVLSFTP